MNIHEAYDMVDRHLRNTLDDDAYAEYSEALEQVFNHVSVTAIPEEDPVVSSKLRKPTGEPLNRSEVEALTAAVSGIYFADSSDYLSSLWSVVRALCPEVAKLLERDEVGAWNLVNNELGVFDLTVDVEDIEDDHACAMNVGLDGRCMRCGDRVVWIIEG